MFLLVSFVCLAMGIRNIYSGIVMPAEHMATKIGLIITGVLLLVFFVLSALQASKEIKEKKQNNNENNDESKK